MFEFSMQACYVILLLSLATEAITEIITTAKITDPLRAYIFAWAFRDTTKSDVSRNIMAGVHGLISCGYCTSVWVAGAAAIVGPNIVGVPVVNWILSAAIIHRISNWIHVVYELVRKGRVRSHDVVIKYVGDDDGSIAEIVGQAGTPVVDEDIGANPD